MVIRCNESSCFYSNKENISDRVHVMFACVTMRQSNTTIMATTLGQNGLGHPMENFL